MKKTIGIQTITFGNAAFVKPINGNEKFVSLQSVLIIGSGSSVTFGRTCIAS